MQRRRQQGAKQWPPLHLTVRQGRSRCPQNSNCSSTARTLPQHPLHPHPLRPQPSRGRRWQQHRRQQGPTQHSTASPRSLKPTPTPTRGSSLSRGGSRGRRGGQGSLRRAPGTSRGKAGGATSPPSMCSRAQRPWPQHRSRGSCQRPHPQPSLGRDSPSMAPHPHPPAARRRKSPQPLPHPLPRPRLLPRALTPQPAHMRSSSLCRRLQLVRPWRGLGWATARSGRLGASHLLRPRQHSWRMMVSRQSRGGRGSPRKSKGGVRRRGGLGRSGRAGKTRGGREGGGVTGAGRGRAGRVQGSAAGVGLQQLGQQQQVFTRACNLFMLQPRVRRGAQGGTLQQQQLVSGAQRSLHGPPV